MFKKEDTLKIKGIAIILLLFHHLFLTSDRITASNVELLFISPTFLQRLAATARICVWIFVFLSAYGLTKQYMRFRNEPVNFVLKYWISLMKSYWFIYVIFFIASFVLFNHRISIYNGNVLNVVLDFWGVADLFGTPMLSGVWWYMCLAQCILIFLPIFAEVCRKIGYSAYFITFVLLQYIPDGIHSESGGLYLNYLLVAVLGVLCAQYNFFEKRSKKSKYKILNFLEAIALCFGFLIFAYLRIKYSTVDTTKVTTAFCRFSVLCICVLVYKYLKNPIIEKIFMFLGRHSGNIFMTHSFIYAYYPQIIYWSRNVIISVLMLILLSCFLSIIIEKAKAIIGYNEWINKVQLFLCKADRCNADEKAIK